jgi:hypothetical protein
MGSGGFDLPIAASSSPSVKPLAVLVIDGIAPDRFVRIQAAAQAKLNQPMTGTSGDVSQHGGDITWSYDSAVNGGELTFNINREFHLGFLHYSASAIQNDLREWVDGIE